MRVITELRGAVHRRVVGGAEGDADDLGIGEGRDRALDSFHHRRPLLVTGDGTGVARTAPRTTMIVVPPDLPYLPHTNSYFHRLYSSLDLLPPGAPGVPYCLLLCFFLFSYFFQLVLVLVLRMYCMDSMV